MIHLIKHTIIAAFLTSTVWSAPEPVKPALSITPFTMKSSDGAMEIKMDDAGKLYFAGKHLASAHAEGKLTSPDGELLVKLNEKGIVVKRDGNAGDDPIENTQDGTWKQGGANLAWVDGKIDLGRVHFSITPKDSPSKRVAALCILALEMSGPDGSLSGSEKEVGPRTDEKPAVLNGAPRLSSSETEFGSHTLMIEPTPEQIATESSKGSKILTADKNKFELKDGNFWFNGKNYGKLPEGSKIKVKNNALSINGKEPVAAGK